jgi:hypothetical protein
MALTGLETLEQHMQLPLFRRAPPASPEWRLVFSRR